MAKPLSWKWKLLIAFVLASLFGFAFVLSPWGHKWMYDRTLQSFNETPENERRDSPLADRFLFLAWWRGAICQDDKSAMEMYREFCGLPKDKKDDSVFTKWKLNSPFCSPDGKTGWGPMHPRAPEAYYEFILYHEVDNSWMRTYEQCLNYYRLFYTWCRQYGPDKKVHPLFNKYWPKIKDLMAKRMLPIPQEIDMKAPLAPPYTPPEGEKPAEPKKASWVEPETTPSFG
ncbi:MAG TPA: hypothetical protein VEJ63_17190 [Planctomycetota bacterium]|nr:hypothetical protein [Planctomycetota bacterium]